LVWHGYSLSENWNCEKVGGRKQVNLEVQTVIETKDEAWQRENDLLQLDAV
jgi:hypothetical protein